MEVRVNRILRVSLVVTLVTVSPFFGCSRSSISRLLRPENSSDRDNKKLAQEISDAKNEVDRMNEQLAGLKMLVDGLESGSPAEVSTETPGFAVARTQFGSFVVLADSVRPYLDGFKVKLEIGNLTSATFRGAKVSVSWGMRFPAKDLTAFAKNIKTRAFDLSKSFRSGAFTPIEVSLTPAKPEDVKTLFVRISLSELSLARSH